MGSLGSLRDLALKGGEPSDGLSSGRLRRREIVKTGAALALGSLGWRTRLARAEARDAVKVGVLLPSSGVYAQLGQDITQGMLLYLDRVQNRAGGRPIQLIAEDETADPSIALSKARKLIESDRVDILTGVVSTAAAYAIRDLVHSSRTIFIVSNAGGNALTRERKSPYIFRVSFTSWQVSFPFGRWVADKVSRRATVLAADYAFGRESVAAFKESFLAAGGQVLDEIWTPLGSTDFSAYVSRIIGTRPGTVYGFLSGSDAVIFIRQYAQFGLAGNVPLTVAGFMVEEDVLPAVGRAALGARSSLHWAVRLDNAVNREFVASYRRRFNASPSVFSMQGYDAARVMVEAIDAVGGDLSNKDRFIQALEGVRFDSPRGRFEFDPATHHVLQNIYVREVRDFQGELANAVIDDLGRVRDVG